MVDIRLYNTKTRAREDFIPIDPDNVRMYVCGPTVYDRAHIGNARAVVVFDMLYRLLRHTYGADHVTYVRNFTDVDDKINARAAETGRPISDITGETTQWFLDDMAALGALEPDEMPRATAYVPQMVAMIKTLIKKGYAYSKPISYGHNSKAVYFNASKAPEHSFFKVESDDDYGALSGRSLDEMIAGHRSEVGEGKENPLDFVLWKPSTSSEPGWESPWGFGRPGWHIECSAMAKALLGDTFDIHGGGLDLQFPHHENEIAQSCCANGTEFMAKVWMHNEMLQVEGKKMSKSLGNFFTVRDLLDQGVPGEVIRFVMLSTHYRKPMDWTERKVAEAQHHLGNWAGIIEGFKAGQLPEGLIDALRDDLNTSKALEILKTVARYGQPEQLKSGMKFLGLLDASGSGWYSRGPLALDHFDGEIYSEKLVALVSDWENLRSAGNYDEADELKSQIESVGLKLSATRSEGPKVETLSSFDPAKLDALK